MLLRPVPFGEPKSRDTRYLDIREHDEFDEAQLTAWAKQASRLPGERSELSRRQTATRPATRASRHRYKAEERGASAHRAD
jgi:hypothetical protein